MDAFATKIIDLLSSPVAAEFKLFWNFKDELEKLKITVSAIKAVLGDAERKVANLQVSDWLENVKDLFLDADDLLDDLSAEALRRQVMTQNKKVKKVRIFFSESNQIAYRRRMGHELKEIMKRLDHLAKVKNDLKLVESPPDSPILFRERPQTYSFVPKNEVIGREEEKNRIISYLLDTNVKDNVSVFAIVGIGGSGKTTLAQLVYNDEVVQNYFEPKMWVCVSDESGFDLKQTAQKILGQSTFSEMEKVQEELRKKVKGKRFLLVLDDVWNEDRELWIKLKNLLVEGGKGSSIIVTTRSEKVVRIMTSHPSIYLEGLDEKESWELFSQVAFEKDEEPNAKLVEIGKDIVRKCAGVPLAIRTLGSMLYSRNLGERDWAYFRDSELSKIDQEGNKIFKILKLSYDKLPSYLKNCFAYCSLFPKDFEMERETLIKLWVAQGFIQSADENRCVEDVAHEYFMMLLSRCLFQDVKADEYGEILKCKMHDLIHDLARLVTENEYIVVRKRKEENFGNGMRHLSSECRSHWTFPTCKVKTNKLRTILSPIGFCDIISSHLSQSATSFPKHLRALELHSLKIAKIPKSIGKLKHLRYIDLSNNDFEKLPEGITMLHNLQTLKLNYCYKLKEFPRDINKMVSLRHLELVDCISLRCMPCGLGQLTHLQTLTKFVVDNRRGSNSARISELCWLNSLRGPLTIVQLEHQRNNAKEVESAKLLIEKLYLRELKLFWGFIEVEENEREQVGYKDEMILKALEPHHTIKRLEIMGFLGKRLPGWTPNLTSLLKLELIECHALTSLPESIGNLTSLIEFRLIKCFSLTSLPELIGNLISLKEFILNGCSSLTSLPKSIEKLTSMKEFELDGCSSLTSLPESIGNLTSLSQFILIKCSLTSLPESIGNLTSLKEFRLNGCSSLTSLPKSIGNLTSLNEFTLDGCSLTSLPESIGNLTSLNKFTLFGCSSLTLLPESIGNLTSLKEFTLFGCSSLTSLPESIGNLTSLNKFTLYVCSSLTSLPESIENLTSLNKFTLNGCSSLISLPESIGNLTSLNKFTLFGCSSLTSLPESIGNLTSLNKFTLDVCSSLTSLPESIENLTSLNKFTLDGCSSLTSLPESIGNLTSLNKFKLFGCASLTSLPESIGNLTSLKEFTLFECSSLTSLPESIVNLPSLILFRLDRCSSLTSLPESIGNLTSLDRFHLRG